MASLGCAVPSDKTGVVGHEARKLSSEEATKLERDKKLISDFKQNKLEKEAQKNWDLFYKRNTTKFFKDRHWTKREFSELVSDSQNSSRKIVLEVGCGVGNFIFPLLEEDEALYFYACDFSQRAVDFVKSNAQFDATRCTVFQCDITTADLLNTVPAESVDATTMIFVLSAVHPDKMQQALQNIYKVLKPGGCLLLRDYGLYDYAMLRFAPGHKLAENFYVRQDGTRAYYFSLEKLEELMESVGFLIGSNEYVQRETVNKKEGICVPRIFVQGKFVKPGSGPISTTDLALNKCDGNSDPLRTDTEKCGTENFEETKCETAECKHMKCGDGKCADRKCKEQKCGDNLDENGKVS